MTLWIFNNSPEDRDFARRMKLPGRLCVFPTRCVVMLLVAVVSHCSVGQSQGLKMTLASDQQSNFLVSAEIPAGFQKLTVESKVQLGLGAWEPRAVHRTNGLAGSVTFQIPADRRSEFFRAHVEAVDLLPDAFFRGESVFPGRAVTSYWPNPFVRGRYYSTYPDVANDVFLPTATGYGQPENPDVLYRRGSLLYVLNPLRGLQVIDLAETNSLTLIQTLPLPIRSQIMFPLAPDHLGIVGQRACRRVEDTSTKAALLTVDIHDRVPKIVSETPIDGDIRASRLVNGTLCVISSPFQERRGPFWVEWNAVTSITSYDLTDPVHPVLRGQLGFIERPYSLAVSDNRLAISGDSWQGTNRVQLISVRADGSLTNAGEILIDDGHTGAVGMWFAGDVLVLSTLRQWSNERQPSIQIYSLSRRAPQFVSRFDFASDEFVDAQLLQDSRLFLTVQSARSDWAASLRALDFGDPRAPFVTGNAILPTRSTRLFSLRDKVVAFGEGTNGTPVLLFTTNGTNPPVLLDQVVVSPAMSWDFINASLDTVRYVPELEAIFIPEQGPEQNRLHRRMRIVEIKDARLGQRGLIDEDLLLRRVFASNGRCFVLAQHKLLDLDSTNLEAPRRASVVQLDWPVHLVSFHQDYLLQITAQYDVNGVNGPSIRVSRGETPEQIAAEFTLPNLPVLGTTKKANRLYVLQGGGLDSGFDFGGGFNWSTVGGGRPWERPPANMTLSVFSLDNLPNIALLGTAEGPVPSSNYRPYIAIWPKSDLLVWTPGNSEGGSGGSQWSFPVHDGPYVSCFYGREFWWPNFNESCVGRLFAFDVADPLNPRMVSDLTLPASPFQVVTAPLAKGGLAFLSHRLIRFNPGEVTPWQPPLPTPQVVNDWSCRLTYTNYPGAWRERWFLDVVDYADARTPTLRRAVNIPGPLLGISSEGNLLYCLGISKNPATNDFDQLEALAYDGVSTFRVDTLPLLRGPRPMLVAADTLFLGVAGPKLPSTQSRVESWTLTPEGKFTRLGSVDLQSDPVRLQNFGGLLAVQMASGIVLVNAMDPRSLRVVGSSENGCDINYPDFADGSLSSGLWIPQAAFGITHVGANRP